MTAQTVDQTTINKWFHPVGQSAYSLWRQGFAAGQFESLLQRGQLFEFDLYGLPHHVFVARAEAMNRTVTFLQQQTELKCLVMVSGA